MKKNFLNSSDYNNCSIILSCEGRSCAMADEKAAHPWIIVAIQYLRDAVEELKASPLFY